MASSALATAFVNIVPGTVAVENYLKTQLGGQAAAAGATAGDQLAKGVAGGFGGKIKGYLAPVLGTMAATFAAVQIKDFLGDSITAASDFNEQGAAVGQVFGKAAKDIEKFAAGGSKSLGQSKTQILEAAKSFGIYGKAAGLAGSDNAGFSTELVKLATDLASFNNTSVDEAIGALGSGLRGEAEPLRRFGVLLDDATLRAKAMEMGLTNSTKTALTPQMKVLAAYGSIMEQTGTQQGDFSRTSEGLANQQRIATAQFENTKIAIGQSLAPAMTDLFKLINTSVLPALQNFFNDFRDGKTPLNDVVDALKGMFGFIKDNWTWISTLAVAVLAGFTAFKLWNGAIAIYQGAIKIAAALQLAFNAVMAANPIMLVVIAIAALVGGLVYFFTQTKTGQKIWAGFVSFLQDAWKNIVNSWNGLVAWFGALPGKIGGFFKSAGTWLLNAGKNIIDGLLKGLGNAGATIGKFFLNILPGWIVGPFKAALGIHSPSRVFIQFGKDIIRGLNKGLSGDEASVRATMDKVGNWVTDQFNAKKISKKTATQARSLIAAYTTKLVEAAKQHDAVVEQLKAAEDSLLDKIKERADFVAGIQRKFGATLGLDDKTTAADAIKQLQDRIAKNKELASVLGQLQALGLSGDLYQQILDGGQLEFAQSLLAGGSEAVTQLNTLAAEANATALKLGEDAGNILYGKGIEVAQGVVDGLKAKESELAAFMASLGAAFASAMNAVIGADTTEADAAKKKKKVTTKKPGAKTPSKISAGKAGAAVKKATPIKKKLALGGLVNRPTRALIGESGPELVTPLRDFERIVSEAKGGQTVIYNAAPNNSLDAEQALFQAIKRAKVVGAW